MPATATPVRFASGALTLEGILYHSEGGPSSRVVVVCHPHPQRGGDMRNSVVGTIAGALTGSGISALTFNFRGVGASEGSFDNGEGEQDDACAAIEFARGLDGVETVAMAGYSFGAGIAARMLDDSVPRVALVSLPTRLLEAPALVSYSGRILLATGSLDDISSLSGVREKAMQLGDKVTVAGISGADHFWWGRDKDLADEIREFFEDL